MKKVPNVEYIYGQIPYLVSEYILQQFENIYNICFIKKTRKNHRSGRTKEMMNFSICCPNIGRQCLEGQKSLCFTGSFTISAELKVFFIRGIRNKLLKKRRKSKNRKKEKIKIEIFKFINKK